MTNSKLQQKDQSPQTPKEQPNLRLIYSHTAIISQKESVKYNLTRPNPCGRLLEQLDRLACAIEVDVNLLSGL